MFFLCMCFPISPHNEGNNKYGCIVTTFWFKLDQGGRGERVGEREGGGRLTFENPFSWRLVQESNYSQEAFFFFFSQGDVAVR